MKRKDDLVAVIKLSTIAVALAILATACDNPLRTDNAGESTPAEDTAVIATYTQTVNQTSSSQDTTIAPVIDGNNNTVIIVVGDDNAPTSDNIRNEPAEDIEEASEPAGP